MNRNHRLTTTAVTVVSAGASAGIGIAIAAHSGVPLAAIAALAVFHTVATSGREAAAAGASTTYRCADCDLSLTVSGSDPFYATFASDHSAHAAN